jgi:hypothetical protein
VLEAAGLGGPTLPLVLLPGLLAAGIGSLVFVGLGSWSGLSTAAWSLSPFPLPAYSGPGWGDFGWTIVLAAVAAVGVFVVMELARVIKRVVDTRPFVLTIGAGLVVGGLAIAFAETTDGPTTAVLFSGESAFGSLFDSAATISLSTLSLLLLFKGLAWSVSLGNFRGGPTFPAIFLGVVGGLMAAHLPGYAETPAVAALVGATCVATLRLPLSSALIASLLTIKAGLAVAPLVIVGVVVAYLVSETLTAYVDSRVGAGPAAAAASPAAGT